MATSTSVSQTGVLLVDEEVVVRAGLRLLINSWPTLHVIAEADTPAEALSTMAALKPNLIVCSSARASVGFLDDLRVVVERAEEIPVVLLTSSRYPQAGMMALQAGVNCVISKKRTAVELRETLEQLRIRRNGAAKTNRGNSSSPVGGGSSGRRLKARI
jgi:two-component system, NarL family, response regulator NreC